MTIAQDILDRLKEAVGPDGWTSEPARLEPHLREWRGRYRGLTPLMLMPASTLQVARILEICHETRTAIVPQGGNTGLVGGQIPSPSGDEILLQMDRMRTIRAIDPIDGTLTAEAGCILADIRAAAEAKDLFFPVSLASEGSAQMGGLLSTNAGGTAVLAYGGMRESVLGLEVALPDGRIWNGLRALRKDNTGYDLKHLFIGAEGTLGVITAAVLRLWPRPRRRETAFVSFAALSDALALFAFIRARCSNVVTGFELMPQIGLAFVTKHAPGLIAPLGLDAPWYALIEVSYLDANGPPLLEGALAHALERGMLLDAALAQSLDQAAAFWALRERMSEAQKAEGASIKHDISVPLSAMARFIEDASNEVTARIPGARIVAFGHVGDGNVHFNVSVPLGADGAAFLARWDEVSALVHGIAARLAGSISAEHGLGQMKAHEIIAFKPPHELDLMRAIKRALDPHGIMNPGKVLSRITD